jgi:quinol monooxygenase YgiN
MTVARFYRMQAAPGKEQDLLGALKALAAAIDPIPGFEGAELLQDSDRPGRVIFIEKWASIQAHKDGGSAVPKEALGAVMAALCEKPESAYFEYVLTG